MHAGFSKFTKAKDLLSELYFGPTVDRVAD